MKAQPQSPHHRRYNGKPCHWCQRPMLVGSRFRFPTTDHVIARALGGYDKKSNKVIACAGCNNLKGDMTVWAWFYFRENVPEWWKLAEKKGPRGQQLHAAIIECGFANVPKFSYAS